MKALTKILTALAVLVALSSCEKETVPPELAGIWLYTDRSEYMSGETVVVRDMIYDAEGVGFKYYEFRKKGLMVVGYEGSDMILEREYHYDKAAQTITIDGRLLRIVLLNDQEMVLGEKNNSSASAYDEVRAYFHR